MKIRIDDSTDINGYDLVVEVFKHNIKGSPVRIPLPGDTSTVAIDLGTHFDIVIIKGKTDEVNGPTKAELLGAIKAWGADANVFLKTGYPRLWETATHYYSGQFGRCLFDRNAGNPDSFGFTLEFKVIQ